METATLIKLIGIAIDSPMLADTEIRFLHALHNVLQSRGVNVADENRRTTCRKSSNDFATDV
jgi:hypothetical protein